MIAKVLGFLRSEIDAYIRQRLGRQTEAVEFSTIVSKGENAVTARVGMALIRIEEDRIYAAGKRHRAAEKSARGSGDTAGREVVVFTQPEMVLALHVLFVAGGNKYDEMLKSISAVVGFFQSRPSFSAERHPVLADLGVDRINVEMQSVNFEVQNHIWASLGGSLRPSVLYLVRFAPIRTEEVDSRRPVVTGAESQEVIR